jgi:hypothetical protein
MGTRSLTSSGKSPRNVSRRIEASGNKQATVGAPLLPCAPVSLENPAAGIELAQAGEVSQRSRVWRRVHRIVDHLRIYRVRSFITTPGGKSCCKINRRSSRYFRWKTSQVFRAQLPINALSETHPLPIDHGERFAARRLRVRPGGVSKGSP